MRGLSTMAALLGQTASRFNSSTPPNGTQGLKANWFSGEAKSKLGEAATVFNLVVPPPATLHTG